MAKRKDDKSTPEHISQMPFAEMLTHFATGAYDAQMGSTGMSPDMQLSLSGPSTKEKKERTRESSVLFGSDEDGDDEDLAFEVVSSPLTRDTILEERKKRTDIDDIEKLEAFDDLIEGAFQADENVSFRNSLISMGRKYAIEGMSKDGGEASEVTKAFSRQEQMIYDLLEEETKAGMEIQRDLDFLRTSRTRSYKSIADLAAVRASLFGQRHSAIAELNKIAEKRFTIAAKMKENAGGGDDTASTRAIQQIFSMGRAALVTGDAPGDSGVTEEEYLASQNGGGNDYGDSSSDPMTVVQTTMPLPPAVTDGDKFIEHEQDNVEYVLDIGEDGNQRNIYAINGAGEVIPDYPLPTDPGTLSFVINELTGAAVDQLQRTYRVRRNGEDIAHEDDD